MTYRGVPFLVTERAGARSAEPPRASGRPLLPRRLSGIRFSTSARRTSQGRALPFVPEGASTPVTPASSGRSENAAPRLSDVDPRTLLLGLLALLAIAVVSALVGTAIARFAFGYVERANSPFATSQQAVNLSTPQSAWEKGAAPQLYQTDPQWAERPYGASTLGALGAAPTCLAMAHVALSGDATVGPVEAAAYAQNNGLAQEDATPLLTDGAAGLGLSAKAVEPDEMALRSELQPRAPRHLRHGARHLRRGHFLHRARAHRRAQPAGHPRPLEQRAHGTALVLRRHPGQQRRPVVLHPRAVGPQGAGSNRIALPRQTPRPNAPPGRTRTASACGLRPSPRHVTPKQGPPA